MTRYSPIDNSAWIVYWHRITDSHHMTYSQHVELPNTWTQSCAWCMYMPSASLTLAVKLSNQNLIAQYRKKRTKEIQSQIYGISNSSLVPKLLGVFIVSDHLWAPVKISGVQRSPFTFSNCHMCRGEPGDEATQTAQHVATKGMGHLRTGLGTWATCTLHTHKTSKCVTNETCTHHMHSIMGIHNIYTYTWHCTAPCGSLLSASCQRSWNTWSGICTPTFWNTTLTSSGPLCWKKSRSNTPLEKNGRDNNVMWDYNDW